MDHDKNIQLGYLMGKLEAMHQDILELKEEQIPHGAARVKTLEKKMDHTIKGLALAAFGAAAALGDSVYHMVPWLSKGG